MIKDNWRVILLTLLVANLVFMALLEMQRLALWRHEQEYFARIQQPSTEKFDYLVGDLSETKKTQTSLFDLLYKISVEINTRVIRVEAATQEVPRNAKDVRDIQARINSERGRTNFRRKTLVGSVVRYSKPLEFSNTAFANIRAAPTESHEGISGNAAMDVGDVHQSAFHIIESAALGRPVEDGWPKHARSAQSPS
jgi:hypothetical protein